ncbi:hypothetical protein D920_00213 [Enterococcus faecalis 13-SD-W-01]|nr:hypothetical protein D920_00213 [Enterococcus faecalis 13-SD-W-01]
MDRFLFTILYTLQKEGKSCEVNESVRDGLERLEIEEQVVTICECFLLFSQFLTSKKKLTYLCGEDYTLIFSVSVLDEYLEDMNGNEDDFSKKSVDLLDVYTILGPKKIQKYLDKRLISYQRFES